MKGGYQTIDLSGINFVTDEAGAEITDEEIRSKIKEAVTSGKPILAYGFRGGHGPNFALIHNGVDSGAINVNTLISTTGTFTSNSVIWTKSTDVIKAYSKQYTLS